MNKALRFLGLFAAILCLSGFDFKVVGVSSAGHYKAYPLKLLRERKAPLEDRVGGTAVKILYEPEADSAQVVETKSGKTLPAVVAYWFAWATFHPDTPVYSVAPQASK